MAFDGSGRSQGSHRVAAPPPPASPFPDGVRRFRFTAAPARWPSCAGTASGFGPTAFVGEGHTDRYGALYADLVFASKHLVEICHSDGVAYVPWESFDDVRQGIVAASTGALPGPVEPLTCPGWTVGGGTGI